MAISIGLFQKKSTSPRRMGLFLTPPLLSPGLPEAQDPSLLSGFPRQKTPLPPGFPGKNIRFKLNLFLIENMHNHV